MITVKMVDDHKINPECMADYAGRGCYKPESPTFKDEPVLDVKNQLFLSSHHTTFEHQLFNFVIDGISISDITFGLHLLNPYYNTDQRSGRFSKMYDNPNFEEIEKHIIEVYGETKNISDVMKFIKFGYKIFFDNIDKATEISKDLLKKRVYQNDKYIELNAKKMAQEQLRNVVSTIFDSWCFFSVDIPTIAAMYEEPLTPGVKVVMDKIKEEFLKFYPNMSYIFRDNERNLNYQSISMENIFESNILNSPKSELINIGGDVKKIVTPFVLDMIPIDKLFYSKKYAENNLININSLINVSIATAGQDQRHRSIKRNVPIFIGDFYAPSIICNMNIDKQIKNLISMWFNLRSKINNSLFDAIAPYGAMVSYKKSANINAFAHEQLKRLCFCTQEEIYNVNRILREDIISKNIDNKFDSIIEMMLPPCSRICGSCFEGSRFCNRDKKNRILNPCPVREI